MNDLYGNIEEKKKKAGTESNKESSLKDWFGRKGAKGKKKGWVDCNAPDGKGGYKACGRGSDEKRKKYPACRPTPGACKERGKGKSWGKKGKSKKNEDLYMDLEQIITEELEKEIQEELGEIVKELEKASKMHAGQAERIQQILDDSDGDKLEEESEISEGLNCGCGQDPCKTYGKDNEKLVIMIKEEITAVLNEKKKKKKKKKKKTKKDACYHKVKSRYKVWPSAYASGALVKCRKVGAKNWGKSKNESLQIMIEDELTQVLEEKKKKPCKPSKGKRFAKRVNGKCRSYGQKGQAKGGGDRIRPGTKKGDAYCARSAKIKKCKNPPCANALSRKKWKCRGSKSMKE
jgi:hypothetical protein|tara:strand:+ start:603 stop:1643 length:1041 start_codon:yes stop_codon:yes gene_type:complete